MNRQPIPTRGGGTWGGGGGGGEAVGVAVGCGSGSGGVGAVVATGEVVAVGVVGAVHGSSRDGEGGGVSDVG